MAIKKAEAFILHTFNLQEQDKIVTLFTREKGIIKGVAKGARKFGNRFGSSLEPLSWVKVVYYEKEGKELVTINQCDLQESFFEMQNDIKFAFTLSYFTEVIQEFFPHQSKEENLFRLLLKVLQALKKGGDLELLGSYFEAWMLRLSGITPDIRTCKKCQQRIVQESWIAPGKDGVYCSSCASHKKERIPPELESFLAWIKKNPPPEGNLELFSNEQIKSIRKTLQNLLIYHMEREPKSLRYLNDS
ncbi:DNA repair protein RecO [Acidobacteriota bacterium]